MESPMFWASDANGWWTIFKKVCSQKLREAEAEEGEDDRAKEIIVMTLEILVVVTTSWVGK